MSTTTLPPIPNNLPANIVGSFNIALTESKFQAIQNEADKLVFDEDNVEVIKDFLAKTRKVTKAIEEVHKLGKAEALQIGRNWDNAKNAYISQVDAITDLPQRKYTELCQSIQKKAQDAENERVRILNIKNGIETNAVNFAKIIADADSTPRLLEIERLINLEKGRKEKYQEFLPEAVERFTQLNVILKNQKDAVKLREELKQKELDAIKTQNDAALLEIQIKQEAVESKIEENKVEVQETAIAQSMPPEIIVPEVILPTVKARRSVWKYKVLDIKETARKIPDWVQMQLNDNKVDDYLKAKKAEGITGESFTVAGIEFYLEKTF